jgi:hypothetical protein
MKSPTPALLGTDGSVIYTPLYTLGNGGKEEKVSSQGNNELGLSALDALYGLGSPALYGYVSRHKTFSGATLVCRLDGRTSFRRLELEVVAQGRPN